MPFFNRKLGIFCLIVLIATVPFCIGKGGVRQEYEATAAHTKTVTITNTTQTDVAFELFTVNKWGKLISNFTWDGEGAGTFSGDELNTLVNFWTIELGEANQADFGDLGFEHLYDWDTFPVVESHTCELFWVDDENLPVTIYYEVDTTKNADHEIAAGTILSLNVKYYNLTGEEATTEASASLAMVLLALGVIAISWRKRKSP
jgi:hypothetical protein